MAKKKNISSKTEIFIRKFQKLEKLLKESTRSSDQTHFSHALKRAAEANSFISKNYGLIEDLYALRNVFSHRARKKYVAQVNKIAVDSLDKIIKNLRNPPTVLSKFGVEVFQAALSDEITKVMKTMHEKTYTHVPIWADCSNNRWFGEMIGVFSYTSFFEWLAERLGKEGNPMFTKRFFLDINRKYLNSPTVNFQFIPENESIYDIPLVFEKNTIQRKRLDCLLITKNGKKNEKITGIITPWDLGAVY